MRNLTMLMLFLAVAACGGMEEPTPMADAGWSPVRASAPAHAQTPRQNPRRGVYDDPRHLRALGDYVHFCANDGMYAWVVRHPRLPLTNTAPARSTRHEDDHHTELWQLLLATGLSGAHRHHPHARSS